MTLSQYASVLEKRNNNDRVQPVTFKHKKWEMYPGLEVTFQLHEFGECIGPL